MYYILYILNTILNVKDDKINNKRKIRSEEFSNKRSFSSHQKKK